MQLICSFRPKQNWAKPGGMQYLDCKPIIARLPRITIMQSMRSDRTRSWYVMRIYAHKMPLHPHNPKTPNRLVLALCPAPQKVTASLRDPKGWREKRGISYQTGKIFAQQPSSQLSHCPIGFCPAWHWGGLIKHCHKALSKPWHCLKVNTFKTDSELTSE